MAVVPTGIEGLPLKFLRELLAESATFQSWVGVGDASAALARIHYVGFSDPGSKTRPYAIVDVGVEDGFSLTKNAGGSSNSFGVGGILSMELIESVDTGQDIADQVVTFINTTGAIIREMSLLAGSDGFLDFMEVMRVLGPLESGKNDRQDLPESIDSLYAFRFAGQTTG